MTQKAIIVKIWYDSEDYTSDINPIGFIKELLELLSSTACKNGYDLNFEILKNEAIDNAFTELTNEIGKLWNEIQALQTRTETLEDIQAITANHTKRLHEIEKVLEDANLWSFEE